MGLIGNYSVLNKSCATFFSGTSAAGAYAGQTRANFISPSLAPGYQSFFTARASIPSATDAYRSITPSNKNGDLATFTDIQGFGVLTATALRVRLSQATIAGVATASGSLSVLSRAAATISGVGSLTASVRAVSRMASNISGVGSVTANLRAIVPVAASLAGSGSVAGNLKGRGSLSASIVVGASDPLSPQALASAVWDEPIADHLDVGSTGRALSDAGGAGNPWSADLATNNTPGTFGGFVQKLLTVAKFLGLK